MRSRRVFWLIGGGVLALMLVAAAIVVIGFILAVSSSFVGDNRITADYPDLMVGGAAEGLGWEYRRIEVKSPKTSAIAVKFRNHPAVALRDMTPQIAFDWQWEGSVIPADEKPLDDHDYSIDGLIISFRKGIIGEAKLFSGSRDLVVTRGGKELKLPVSKSDFEADFGPPIRTETHHQTD
jgi:hypothetical protein